MSLVIAIDGPAGAGKSTLAKRLAAHYGIGFLDTGLLYRAVARKMSDLGLPIENEQAAVEAAKDLQATDLDASRLYGEGIGNQASKVAALPELRQALLPVQRRMAMEGEGSVVAGRDIGSVVLPDCAIKFFITASIEERARRRAQDLRKRGETPTSGQVLAELIERDQRDEERAVAPLVISKDAEIIDTSNLDADLVFAKMVQVVDERLKGAA